MKTDILIGALAVLLIICIPFGAIWSLNTLFGLAIPYTWRTLIAALLLAGIVSHSSARRAA